MRKQDVERLYVEQMGQEALSRQLQNAEKRCFYCGSRKEKSTEKLCARCKSKAHTPVDV